MKFRDKEYVFTTNKITDIWCAINSQRALCENKEISVKVKAINEKARPSNFQARNKIICSLERIEDGLDYLNSYELIPNSRQRNAFGFVNFINCEYVIVHCIEELAKIYDVDIKKVTNSRKCFSDFKYGNGSDKEVFEYIRSLCAVHPTDTSMHPTVHMEREFDCCSRIVWDNISITDERDLTAVVYPSEDEGEAQYLGIRVEPFVIYLKQWIKLLYDIEKKIYSFISDEKEKFRKVDILNPEDFDDYMKYIDNLHVEYKRRFSDSHDYLFDSYKLVFRIYFDNEETEKKKECYKKAVMYMFDCLHKQMQEMDERKYTGIVDLPDNCMTSLFYELYLPIEGRSKFSNERTAFTYVDNLNSSYQYDVRHAREVLDVIKPLVNEYVEFYNTESQDETHLLLQIATYFDALKQEGYINRSIPNTTDYRGEMAMFYSDKESAKVI